MQPLSQMSLRDLLRRQEQLEQAVALAAPDLWMELQLVRRLIDNFDSEEKPYAKLKWQTAIPLCLKRNRAWMTREQIQRDLEAGGFVISDPKTFPYILGDSLRYYAGKGELARRDENGKLIKGGSHKPNTRFRNEQYGLPEWAKDPSIGTLK